MSKQTIIHKIFENKTTEQQENKREGKGRSLTTSQNVFYLMDSYDVYLCPIRTQ
jgi:hypothetical protein